MEKNIVYANYKNRKINKLLVTPDDDVNAEC